MKLESAKNQSKIIVDLLVACWKSKQTFYSIICPRILLKVDVEDVARSGLSVTIIGSVYCTSIHSNHLGGYKPEDYDNHED